MNRSLTYLTGSVRSYRSTLARNAGSKRRAFSTGILVLYLSILTVDASGNTISKDNLKLYAHSRIVNELQYNCFNSLIFKESGWHTNAINGSHYGLGPMRNPKYRNLDGFRQIDWSLRYIVGRYGSMCNAWRFFKLKGYH